MASIADGAFQKCASLTSVTIPDTVTSIRRDAFRDCTSLTSVTIPNSVVSIENSAFSGCSSLASVTISDSVRSIQDYAFSGCLSLASVTIPDSVRSIGSSAFGGCSSLASITIPDSVTSIGDFAFNGCSLLAIYVGLEYAPKGWESSWNGSRPVYYGYQYSKTIDGVTYVLQKKTGINSRPFLPVIRVSNISTSLQSSMIALSLQSQKRPSITVPPSFPSRFQIQ